MGIRLLRGKPDRGRPRQPSARQAGRLQSTYRDSPGHRIQDYRGRRKRMSLRMRLILSFTAVIILCLAVVALAVTVSLRSIRDDYNMDQLTNMARPIYVQVLSLARGEETWRNLLENLQEQSTNNNVYIFLADKTGRIVRYLSPEEEKLLITQLPVESPQMNQLPADSLAVSATKPVQGTFEAPDGRNFVYTSYFIGRSFTGQAFLNIETLTLAVPRTGTLSILAGLFGPFLRIGLIALAVSIVIAFRS